MARRYSVSRARRTHPTKQLLFDTAVELLGTVPIDELSLAMVLERSGVTSGSLYHHFDDLPDLIEQAVAFRYSQRLRESLDAVGGLLDCADADDFRKRAEELFLVSVTAPRVNRLTRVEVMGMVQSRPRLAAAVAQAQQEITDEQADLYREFQRRGWMRTDMDPVALSAFVQGMVLGHVVSDVAERPIDDDVWVVVAMRALRAVVFTD